jgi:hypothetical protein
VHRHLCRCARCRAELAHLEALREILVRAPVPELRDAALTNLMASIEHLEQERAESCLEDAQSIHEPDRETRRRRDWSAWLSPVSLVPLATTACLALAISLAIKPGAMQGSAEFRTLSSRSAVAATSDRDLQVIFEAGVDRRGIDALAASVNGRIIDGPSPLGIYTVRIEGDGATEDDSPIRAAERLKANAKIVFAEPVVPPLSSESRTGPAR